MVYQEYNPGVALALVTATGQYRQLKPHSLFLDPYIICTRRGGGGLSGLQPGCAAGQNHHRKPAIINPSNLSFHCPFFLGAAEVVYQDYNPGVLRANITS